MGVGTMNKLVERSAWLRPGVACARLYHIKTESVRSLTPRIPGLKHAIETPTPGRTNGNMHYFNHTYAIISRKGNQMDHTPIPGTLELEATISVQEGTIRLMKGFTTELEAENTRLKSELATQTQRNDWFDAHLAADDKQTIIGTMEANELLNALVDTLRAQLESKRCYCELKRSVTESDELSPAASEQTHKHPEKPE